MAPRMIRFALAMAALLATAPSAIAADQALRPELGKPLQAAQEAIRQQKFRDALVKIKEAEQAGSLSPQETVLVEQLRGIAASGAADYTTAAKAFEAAIATGQLSGADQTRLTQAVGNLYYQAKDYPKAISWLRKTVDGGGGDDASRTLLAQAYYLGEDYAQAAKVLTAQIAAADQAGRSPSETQLQLLANAQVKTGDTDGYAATLEKLASATGKADYWAGAIQGVEAKSGFSRRLSLDVLRLSLAAGTLTRADSYTEAAELALQGGLPAEAKSFLDRGFAKGVLGTGTDGDRHKRLRASAGQKADSDSAALAQNETEAKEAKDGNALVNTGLAFVSHGQAAKGAQLIEQGIAKGGLRNADDAKLHLGLAYLAAGQKEKAQQAFKSVQGKDGSQDLARLWLALGKTAKG